MNKSSDDPFHVLDLSMKLPVKTWFIYSWLAGENWHLSKRIYLFQFYLLDFWPTNSLKPGDTDTHQ